MDASTMTSRRGALWRSRWAAIGAAVAVSLGAGGLWSAHAAGGTPSNTVLVDPVRILDTRDPNNVGLAGPFVSPVGQTLQVTGSIPTATGTQTVVPAGATGVLLNVTSVSSTANGFIAVRPGDATGAPSTSSLNVTAGTTVPNAVAVALPTSGADAGKIEITWDALGLAGPTTDILVDVVGYTAPPAPPRPGPSTQAHSNSSAPLPTDTSTFAYRSITTTQTGQLQLSLVARSQLTCATGSEVSLWIEVDGIVVQSSRVNQLETESWVSLQGVTSSPVPAGLHEVSARIGCRSAGWSAHSFSTVSSWIVTVLDQPATTGSLDAPAPLVDEETPANCETVDEETTCTRI